MVQSSRSRSVSRPSSSKREWIGIAGPGRKDQRQTIFGGRPCHPLGSREPDGGRARKRAARRKPGPAQYRTAQAYRALDKANRDLERLDQTKSDFISIASHELRTPLTTMIGYTEMLMEDHTLPPAVQRNAQKHLKRDAPLARDHGLDVRHRPDRHPHTCNLT